MSSRRPDYEMSEVERASTVLPTLRNLLREAAVEVTANTVSRRESGAEESSLMRNDELASAKPALLLGLQRVLSPTIERSGSDECIVAGEHP